MRQLEQSLRRLKTDVPRSLADSRVRVRQRSRAPLRARRRRRSARARATRGQGALRRLHRPQGSGDPPRDARRTIFRSTPASFPLNCFDGSFRSFEQQVLPELLRRGIAPIGMKSLGGDGRQVKKKVITAQEGLRYAMSLPVATTVSGIDSMKVLRQNVASRPGSSRCRRGRWRCSGAACATRPPTDASSSTRPPPGTKVPSAAKQHKFPSDDELSA